MIKVTRLRNGSRGFVMKEKSKFAPSCSGLQYPGAAPCGCQMPRNRRTGAAAVFFRRVCAGTMRIQQRQTDRYARAAQETSGGE